MRERERDTKNIWEGEGVEGLSILCFVVKKYTL